MNHKPPCTTRQCKCYENGEQQTISKIINYIQTQGAFSQIPDNEECEHGVMSWYGCETCALTNLTNNLIKGQHNK